MEVCQEKNIVYANKYDGKCDEKYINDFCRYIDISRFQFNKSIKKLINKKLFIIQSKGKNLKVKKKFIVGEGLKN